MTTAYGTLAYGVVLGLGTMTALAFVSLGLRRSSEPGRPFMFAFAFLSGVGAVSTWIIVELHTSETVDEYRLWFMVFGLLSLLLVVALVLVVATWTRAIPRLAQIAFGAATVVIGALQIVLPDGLLVDEIVALRPVGLFGESFVVHVADRSAWRTVLDVYLVLTLVLIVVALGVHARRGRRLESVVISLALLVMLTFAAYDSLVDDGVVDTPYLAPFGGALVAVAGLVLIDGRVARAERKVAQNSVRLEQTVVERTAALIAANDELNQQLARQRVTTQRLEVLTAEFERGNQLVGPGLDGAATAARIESILETLGSILGLRRAALRLSDRELPDVLPSISEWTDADCPLDDAAPERMSEPVTMEGAMLGSLEVEPRDSQQLGDEELRYVRLAAKHLAGFVHRTELDGLVAADAVDLERHRIARDLHDSVTQRLYSMAFLAEAAKRQLDEEPEIVADTVERIRTLLLTSLSELRVLLFELQPQSLDAARLRQLLEQLVETVAAGFDARVDAELADVPALPRNVKLGMYRLAQESLSNAVRHSHADTITVCLQHDGVETVLAVSDTGVGFDPAGVRRGHGLGNLEERAASIGARLDIHSVAEVGTVVTVNWQPARTGT